MIRFPSPAAWAHDRTPAEWARHHVKVVAILIALGLLGSYPVGVFILAVLTAPRSAPPATTPTAPTAVDRIGGSGVVVSMNDTMGTITVQHFGIPRLNLPAGTTGFPATTAVFKRTEVGDQLDFSLSKQDGVYVITGVQNDVLGGESIPQR